MRPQVNTESFRLMQLDFPLYHCWWCGRSLADHPEGWYMPWLIERAHIVNNPRVEDRRVCIMLCSMCHQVQHGAQLVLPGMRSLCAPTLAESLWIKLKRDPSYYDREFLQEFSIRKIPRARAPRREVLRAYADRRWGSVA